MKLPVPVLVLTGFLGSGKTTLLKGLLRKPEFKGTAVIINEFGDVGLDDALIEAADEEVVLLPSGCVCCAVRSDLVEAFNRLYAQWQGGNIPDLTRVIVETSGLADPAPIAHTLMSENDLFRIYQLDGVIAAVDCELVTGQLERYAETAKQIALADRIILTKTDRVESTQIESVVARLRGVNPAAPIKSSVMGECPAEILTGLAAYEPAVAKHHASAWLSGDAYESSPLGEALNRPEHGPVDRRDDDLAHTHTHGVISFAMVFERPLDGQKLSFAMELLRMTHGEKLLRVKGIVAIAGEDLPFVVHGVQHMFYPPTTLESWPTHDRRSKFVFITQNLTRADIDKVLRPLLDESAIERKAFFTADGSL
ncbi:MAG: CobW family GTP-binding protein [Hyphomicrobiaceae bacterium]